MPVKKQKKLKNSNTNRKITGVVLLALSALMFLSTNVLKLEGGTQNTIGPVGMMLSKIMQGLFGDGQIIVPLILFAWSMTYLFSTPKVNKTRLFVGGLVLVFLGGLGFLSISLVPGLSFKEAYLTGFSGKGGGITGMVLAWLSYHSLGKIGSAIIYVTMIAVGAIILLEGMNLHVLHAFIAGLVKKINERKALKARRNLAKAEKSREKGENLLKKKDLKENKDNMEIIPPSLIKINGTKNNTEENFENIKNLINDKDLIRVKNSENNKSQKPDVGIEDGKEIIADLEKSLNMEKQADKASASIWQYPPLSLLNVKKDFRERNTQADIQKTARYIEDTLASFGVRLKIDEVSCGPAITRYEAKLAPGIKVSKIIRLADDIALNLAAENIRIEAPIPGKAAIGIEVPNKEIAEVSLNEILKELLDKKSHDKIEVALGKDIAGKAVFADLTKMPHLLVAGATGSGKSVCMNTLICSMLFNYSPNELKFLMIDPKKVELSIYNDIPHLVAPVIVEPKKAATALRWMTAEMENRYSLFAAGGTKDIHSYNNLVEKGKIEGKKMPFIVILIDELADLMMVAPADVEESICRLAQMARAAGMHLVIATQRPSVNVITGLIKANIPSRIAFAVSSQVDSRTIIDSGGAERLLGRGDMLFAPVSLNKPLRLQGAFISEKEVTRVVEFLKNQGKPEYLQGMEILDKEEDREETADSDHDILLSEAAALVIETGQASISMLQRKMKVGYARAARIIDQLEEKNIVGQYEGSKARSVIANWDDYNRIFGE